MWSSSGPEMTTPEEQAAYDALNSAQAAYDTAYHAHSDVQSLIYKEQAEAANVVTAKYQAKYGPERDRLYTAYCEAQRIMDAARAAYRAAQATLDTRQSRATSRMYTRVANAHSVQLVAASDAMTAADTTLQEANRKYRAFRYRRGLQPVSDANNGGEAIISPDGTVFMVPAGEDHGNVYEVVCKQPEQEYERWMRFTASGGLSNAYKSYYNDKYITDAQRNSALDLADAHDACAAEMEAAGRVSTPRAHRSAANNIRARFMTAPSDDD